MTTLDFTGLRRRSLLRAGAGASLLPGAAMLPRAAVAADYKALVCIHLFGGNDALNMIVPTDPSHHERYASVRARLALPRDRLLPLEGTGVGLHPAMGSLAELWRRGRAVPVFNVGPLERPLTKAAYLEAERNGELPERLFSHADQISLWDTASLTSSTRSGWGGRASEALATTNPVVSVAGTSRFGSGVRQSPWVLPPSGTDFIAHGIDPASSQAAERSRRAALDALMTHPPSSALGQVYAATQQRALDLSARLSALVRIQPGDPQGVAAIDQAFAPLIKNGDVATALGKQLYQVAKLIAGRTALGGDRQIFFTSMGGFDTHRSQAVPGEPLAGRQAPLLAELADALAAFHAAMDALGIGDGVTTFTQTEFGRTFAPNRNDGTDHGWGNTQWVAGAAVQGGTTYGRYPELVLGGDDDVSPPGPTALGRWIPSASVDQYAATLLGWFGVTEAQLDAALPNLQRFGEQRRLGFL